MERVTARRTVRLVSRRVLRLVRIRLVLVVSLTSRVSSTAFLVVAPVPRVLRARVLPTLPVASTSTISSLA
jgi:hypothetical protein